MTEKNFVISLEDHFLYSKVWDYFPEELKDKYRLLKDKLLDVGENRIKEMDAAGIDFQVISHVDPGVNLIENVELAVQLSREANNCLFEAIKVNTERLGGFALLPMQSPKEAADELERSVRELHFKGAMINGHTHGVYLDDDSNAVLLQKAEELDVPLYIHPTDPPAEIAQKYYGNNDVVITGWAWQVETSLHLIRMINKGIFDKYPNLKIIIGHMGELIPFGFTRLNLSLSLGNWIINPKSDIPAKNLHYYFKHNVFVTSSGVFDEPVFRCAKEMTGLDNMMFSVDYPFQDNIKATEFLNKLSLNDMEKSLFAGANAATLLKLKQSKGTVAKASKWEIFRIRLKSKIGKALLSKLVK
jgi:predicted TIM-barrel fold metal-dependent hydrolase